MIVTTYAKRDGMMVISAAKTGLSSVTGTAPSSRTDRGRDAGKAPACCIEAIAFTDGSQNCRIETRRQSADRLPPSITFMEFRKLWRLHRDSFRQWETSARLRL